MSGMANGGRSWLPAHLKLYLDSRLDTGGFRSVSNVEKNDSYNSHPKGLAAAIFHFKH
jgi:hypothetical protein